MSEVLAQLEKKGGGGFDIDFSNPITSTSITVSGLTVGKKYMCLFLIKTPMWSAGAHITPNTGATEIAFDTINNYLGTSYMIFSEVLIIETTASTVTFRHEIPGQTSSGTITNFYIHLYEL